MRKNGNKIFLCILILACFTAIFCLCGFLEAKTAAIPINKRLSGKILLQVESKGEAWYVKPDDSKRYYLGKPSDAFAVMRDMGLGISEKDYQVFEKNNKAQARLAGKILLRVEKKGEAYYVSPLDLKMYYLGKPKDAFSVMRKQGLGITNKDLEKIGVGDGNKTPLPPFEKRGETQKPPPAPSSKDGESTDSPPLTKGDTGGFEPAEKPCVYENGCAQYKGVKIKWIVDEDTFPPEWVADKERINPSAESVTDKDKIDRSIRILKKGMDKYPEYFFADSKNKISTVNILKHISAFHENMAGTLSVPNRIIYLTVCAYDEAEYFEQAFHHEYSHLLYWRNYDYFPEKEWDKINPEGFEYGREKENAMWGGIEDEANRNNGFIRNYSKFGRDEDFAVLVESLFKNSDNSDGNLWLLKEKYKRIGQKTDIVIEFYHKLDPIFTEEYFRKVAEE